MPAKLENRINHQHKTSTNGVSSSASQWANGSIRQGLDQRKPVYTPSLYKSFLYTAAILTEAFNRVKISLSPSFQPIKLRLHSSGPALTNCSHLVESADQLRLRNIDMDDFMSTSAQWTVKYSRFCLWLICLNRSSSFPWLQQVHLLWGQVLSGEKTLITTTFTVIRVRIDCGSETCAPVQYGINWAVSKPQQETLLTTVYPVAA